MAITIRTGRASDAAAASELARRAKASHDYPADWLHQWSAALSLSGEQLEGPMSLVALAGDEIVGVCVLEQSGTQACFEHLWVLPEHHGRGIGRLLAERGLELAARAGVTTVEVEADPYAEDFYLRLGARRTGQIPAPMPGAPKRILPVLQFDLPARAKPQ